MPSDSETQRMITQGIAAALGTALTTGNIWYVDSGHAKARNSTPAAAGSHGRGRSPNYPFASIHYASTQCTASNGDVIVAMPGHEETVSAAAGLVLAKAGVTVIGIGSGSNKPTVTLGTATTADVDVDAANVCIKNIRFVGNIDDLAVMIDANADGLVLEDCEFITSATKECLNFINFATTKDNLIVRRCRFLQPADPAGTDGAAATGAIYVVDTENIVVEDCTFDGFFETACFHNKTTACKYLTWRRNNVNQLLTITGRRLLLVAGVVGMDIGVDTDFIPGLGYKIQKTEDVNTATADVLFTVAGKVRINEWYGEVTNALHTTVSDYALAITSGGTLQAAGDINSAVIGHTIRMNSDSGDTTLATTSPAVSVTDHADLDGDSGPANRIIGREGLTSLTLQATRTAGAAGDAILHTIWWQPLEPGAYVIAAA